MGYRKRPSDAGRWGGCPASLSFTAKYPNNSTSAADEGTAAHWIREQCLEMGFDAYDFIGTVVTVNGVGYECDNDMADALQPGIDWIREQDHSLGLFTEQKVDVTHITGPDENGKPQTGTLDCGWIGKDVAGLSDLKYGKGVPVQAVDNDQQVMYLSAFYRHYVQKIAPHIERFIIVIDQPRNGAGGGEWELTLDQLLKHEKRLKRAGEKCDEDNPQFNPNSKSCQWCPAANEPGRPGGCPAHAKWVSDMIDLDVDDLDKLDEDEPWTPPDLEQWTPERIAKVAVNKSAISKFIDYCTAMTLDHALRVGPIGGVKAVAGRAGHRKWANPGAAEVFMKGAGVDPFNKVLKSPAQVAKVLGKKKPVPESLIERNEPKPILAPVADKRPAVKALSEEVDDLDEDGLSDTDDLDI